jgi:hypothetical protein
MRAAPGGQPRPEFTVATLEKLAKSLESGAIKHIDRLSISDDVQPGLRAIIRNTGAISFHVHYAVAGSRPMLKIGEHPGTSIAEARSLAATVLTLADKGIDPQVGLHERLIRELKEKGARWRP